MGGFQEWVGERQDHWKVAKAENEGHPQPWEKSRVEGKQKLWSRWPWIGIPDRAESQSQA